MATLPPVEEMRKAYLARDASYDGIFVLGVRSTGIFCRPSCGARKPHPKNVEFFATPREAVFSGYRPCKRCTPMSPREETPAWVTRLLGLIDRDPHRKIPDTEIRSLGVDPTRARRYFQRHFGMTFQAYCRGRRLGRALQEIRKGSRLDDVALGHGFQSHSGFREAFGRAFGMPPGKAHATEAILVSWIDTPLGPMIAGATSSSLVLLEFTERRMLAAQIARLCRFYQRTIVPGENSILRQIRLELEEYFSRKRTRFSVPLEFPGSPFQQKVWRSLLTIPYGSTRTYEQLARFIGQRNAQRAVGHSNGLNRLAIVIPCHRVVNKDGTLGGYGGGIWRKQALLELERGSVQGEEAVSNRDQHPSSAGRRATTRLFAGYRSPGAGTPARRDCPVRLGSAAPQESFVRTGTDAGDLAGQEG
jgi:AraC family transcriptional regulator of adaptative response/methylated-DNA-[protein]-cysteine methyltransferase